MPDKPLSAEQEMYSLLSMLSLPEIESILTKLASSLPSEQKNYYMNEIKMWGSLGQKQILINNIIDLVAADEIMEELDEFDITGDKDDKYRKDVDRYFTPGEQMGWSPETEAPHRTPYHGLPGYPGYPDVKLEKDRVKPHPEKDYMYEDYWDIDWDIPEFVPHPIPPLAFEGKTEKDLKFEIYEALKYMHKPFICMMVEEYLQMVDPAAARKFYQDGVSSQSRYGFNKQRVLNRMFKSMNPDDLVNYWNAIVNYQELPYVNYDKAYARYGGGIGKNIIPKWGPTEEPIEEI
jgi:hypothetical protein